MFIPPHCPYSTCINYSRPSNPFWYTRNGSHDTKTFGRVPRFRCKACERTFSTQTFSIDYYSKMKLNYVDIYTKINSGTGIRTIARDMRVKPESIINRINRMGRTAVILNQFIISQIDVREHMVLDGIQNFCFSQFFPDNYTIIVGKKSQFVYDCDYATIRRGGRMTDSQKKRRDELSKIFKASVSSVYDSFGRLLDSIDLFTANRQNILILYTDMKYDYVKAINNWSDRISGYFKSGMWIHERTSSKLPRTIWNPLFSVNYMDREFRKDMAGLTRETVQFPKNVCNAMLRMYLYMFDHNIRKPYRINNSTPWSFKHSSAAGLSNEDRQKITKDFFFKRYFLPRGFKLSESAKKTINREWITPLKEKPEKLWKYLAVV